MHVEELLRLEGITKSFGSAEVLRGLDLTVLKGEFITLLGPSGCGKTTTLRIIAGLEEPDAGRVFLAGQDVTGLAPHRRDVRMVFQNYALFPHMNVEQNIGYSLKLKKRPSAEIRETVAGALDLVQLGGYEKRRPQELSGGQRQRVALARAVVSRPRVLLLDEPLGALDLQLRRRMQSELKGLQQRLGITFIYITHDQEEALTMSDRIAVMRDGRFEQTGSAAFVYEHPETSYVARFVGGANVLTGTVLEAASGGESSPERGRSPGIIHFEHPGGRGGASYNPRPGVPLRGSVTVVIRGEYLELSPAAGNGPADRGRPEDGGGKEHDGLTGVILGRSFAGGQLRITVRLDGSGEEISASRPGFDFPLKDGERVRVGWKAEHAVVVDTGNGA
ncbi:MAG: ABC transporter ATP-binding protein [Treponema sp.]|jgi:spermidine/putrescine transport system ATP-binding protein|nr:ABC transporter ATP-binding protein [Treponema sp.]